jgi:hypothetical protein
MNELTIFSKIFLPILIFVFVTPITFLILKFLYDTYKVKRNVNKKLVYVSTLKISYIPGTGGLITSRNLSYESDTYEKAIENQNFLRGIGEKIYKRYNSISDKELINIENILIIPKEKFIAAELGSHTEYKSL